MEQTRLTVEHFDQWVEDPENADKLFEFVAGEVVEVPSNAYASKISQIVAGELYIYLKANAIGHLTGEAGGYQVAGERYAPDVAFISFARQPELDTTGYNSVPPDLAVEVSIGRHTWRPYQDTPVGTPGRVSALTPDESAAWQSERYLRTKVVNYLSEGTQVWVITPEERTVEIFQAGQPVRTLRPGDVISCGALLPGFSLPVNLLFPPPTEN